MWIILIVSCIPPLRPSFVLVFSKLSRAIGISFAALNDHDGYTPQKDEDDNVSLKSLPRAYMYPRSRKYDAEVARFEEEGRGFGGTGIMRTMDIDVDYEGV